MIQPHWEMEWDQHLLVPDTHIHITRDPVALPLRIADGRVHTEAGTFMSPLLCIEKTWKLPQCPATTLGITPQQNTLQN